MVEATTVHRVLLRAELLHEGRMSISHTLEISEASARVQSDQPPPIGATVHLQLSFPRLLAPLALETEVVAHHASSCPGDEAAMTLQFRFRSDEEHELLSNLIERVSVAGDEISPAQASRGELGYRVLLVEDNHMIRDIFAYGVRKYFRSQHSRVTVDLATDGREAWEMLQAELYDLAIVDFYLPVLDGSRLVARMRREPRLATVPVVAISVGGKVARDAMLEAGADLYLDKPIILRDLFSTLERLALGGTHP